MLHVIDAGATTPASSRDRDQIGLDVLLERVSSERYQVFVLHHALDYTVEEISELTGTPVGTVKDRLVMARKQLRRLVDLERARLEAKVR